MGPHIPVLTTERLIIRPFVLDDLAGIHRILDHEAMMEPQPLEERRNWLEWSIRNYVELEKLFQPPYGDRAIVRKEDHRLVGSVGLVPQMGPYGQLPSLGGADPGGRAAPITTEMGLFWALETAARGHGYATEAARALVEYIFGAFNMARLVATTEHANLPSQRVMERLGMRLVTNPLPDPPWFQVVGILENPAVAH
jgi:RimJ/RimL family protein N-acetyltransferase